MRDSSNRAFALVIVLALLSILIVAVFAISHFRKVDSQLSATSAYQVKARQNALTALDLAIAKLQSNVGDNNVLTGIAGIAGIPSGRGNSTRHWCGVWDLNGNFVQWLVSGNQVDIQPTVNGDFVELVGVSSVGADATDRERTNAPLVTVNGGRYAYWIGDCGVKLSIIIPDSSAAVLGERTSIEEQFPSVNLGDDENTLISYEQLRFAGATTAQLQGGFHTYTLSHVSYDESFIKTGLLNVNSNSVRYLTGLWTSYAEINPSGAGEISASSFANHVSVRIQGPLKNLDEFFAITSPYLTSEQLDPLEFDRTMRGWLTVRSQTFIVRAYGDAINPADVEVTEAGPEATAYCEAIVQRTDEDAPLGNGKKFVITYFRWLGPDDI